MTLSAKQIIADREAVNSWCRGEVTDDGGAGSRRAKRRSDLEDFFLSLQPRPIEEAPKDGTEILACHSGEGEWATVWWDKPKGEWVYIGMDDQVFYRPTHFIPLSALPLPEDE